MSKSTNSPAKTIKESLTSLGVTVISARMDGKNKFSITVIASQKELAARLMFSMGVRYAGLIPNKFLSQNLPLKGSKTERVVDFNNLIIKGGAVVTS